MLFQIGDYLAGAVIGMATALIVRAMISPGMDMVIAMLLGMGAGTIASLFIGYMLAPILGIFETLVPGSLTGMFGGMLFAMRDAMAAGSRTTAAAIIVGAIFGIVVTAVMKLYDHVLRESVVEAGD